VVKSKLLLFAAGALIFSTRALGQTGDTSLDALQHQIDAARAAQAAKRKVPAHTPAAARTAKQTQSGGAGSMTSAQDPLLATVNNAAIHRSDVQAWIDSHVSAEQRQQLPQDKLFSAALDNLISGKALQTMARTQGLDSDPQVQRDMKAARNEAAANELLQRALLIRKVRPTVTEDAIKAAYDRHYAGKPGETEVRARHILVDSEAKAQNIISQLRGGARFEDLAKTYGDPKDPVTQNGGDLGFFKRSDMLPEFSAAAFSLSPGEFSTIPVRTKYGWHVIQVLDTRISTPQTYNQMHDQIVQLLLRQGALALVKQARSQVKIVQYGPDQLPLR
jgi:peptidyl-prolyl cis-trans isomerase C